MQQIGQVRSNGNARMCYGQGQSVAAGATVTLAKFQAVNAGASLGLSVGFGLSDVAQYANGAAWKIYIAGIERLHITDQLSDMLRPEFLPLQVKAKDEIRIDFINGSSGALVAGVFARIEAI